MCEFLTSMGFTRCHKEYCLFVKRVGNTDDLDINSYGYSKTWSMVCLYVDDLTVISRCDNLIKELYDE
jgi:hypothetical protein